MAFSPSVGSSSQFNPQLDIDRVMIDSSSHLFKNLGLPIWAEFYIGPQQMDNPFFLLLSQFYPKVVIMEDNFNISASFEISKVLIQIRHDRNIKVL
jgi:hypothetical protein